MPRRGRVTKRKISPDAKYKSVNAQRFINKMMRAGKKAIAENIFYTMMDELQRKTGKDPIAVFEQALKNATPMMEVKARRVGGSTYQIPVEVDRARGNSIAMRWIRESADDRQGRSMAEKLTAEMLDAFNSAGGAIKKREDLHKTAEANKAFAHFRW